MDHSSDQITHSLFTTRVDATEAERAALEDEIIRRHLSLSRALAHRYLDRGADREDLVQVANLALVKAMHGFDPAKGSFVPFATATILGEIKRHFRDHCWTVRVPRRLQELQADISRASDEHWQVHSTAPTSADLARNLGVDESEVREAMAATGCYSTASLDISVRDDGQTTGDLIADDTDDFRHVDDLASVSRAVRGLEPDQRELIGMRFFDDLTQQQIADRSGVSQMQVSRRLSRIISDLRTTVGVAPAA